MSAPVASLRLAPGSGLVCRRGSALLFVSAPDPALIDAFATSDEGAELQMLASATVAAGFDVHPYVGLAWGDGLRVMAFGDISVETDQPSLPMLSGAGSRTWVEHTLALGGRAVVEVAGGAVDEVTDLGAGTVAAGGFRLELGVVITAEEPTLAPPTEPVVADETRAVPRTAPDPAPPSTASPAAVDPDDPVAALAAIQAAAVGADGEPVQSAGVAPTAPTQEPEAEWTGDDEPHDTDVTLPPPVSEVLLADVRGADTTDGRGSLVDAKLCANSHANPPTAATCAVCGDFLAPGTGAMVHVPRPSLGRLQLDDGELIELDQELLIGRNPDRDDEPSRARLRPVKALGDKVSRSHLEVRFQEWDVLVDDCGSTNGTFVVAHPGGQVMPLEPGRPQMVEPGAVVYFGSRSLTVLDGMTMDDDDLHVDFIGELRTVEPGEELTFGRQADLHIDDNRHLHRVLGRFWSRGDAWWLTNEGRSITIQIADADSRSSVQLAPGSDIALSFPNSILRFRAGITDYEVIVRVPDRAADDVDDDPLDTDDEEGGETIGLGDLMLTDEQRLLLLALAEGTLRDPHHGDDLPTNRAVARRLGWSITKFNRKLDNLCDRFTRLGVGGLRGSIDQLATDRRRRLVEHAIESGLIDRGQLERLPPDIE